MGAPTASSSWSIAVTGTVLRMLARNLQACCLQMRCVMQWCLFLLTSKIFLRRCPQRRSQRSLASIMCGTSNGSSNLVVQRLAMVSMKVLTGFPAHCQARRNEFTDGLVTGKQSNILRLQELFRNFLVQLTINLCMQLRFSGE